MRDSLPVLPVDEAVIGSFGLCYLRYKHFKFKDLGWMFVTVDLSSFGDKTQIYLTYFKISPNI
jgi:hypothetical protein